MRCELWRDATLIDVCACILPLSVYCALLLTARQRATHYISSAFSYNAIVHIVAMIAGSLAFATRSNQSTYKYDASRCP